MMVPPHHLFWRTNAIFLTIISEKHTISCNIMTMADQAVTCSVIFFWGSMVRAICWAVVAWALSERYDERVTSSNSMRQRRNNCKWQQLSFGPSFGVSRTDTGEAWSNTRWWGNFGKTPLVFSDSGRIMKVIMSCVWLKTNLSMFPLDYIVNVLI